MRRFGPAAAAILFAACAGAGARGDAPAGSGARPDWTYRTPPPAREKMYFVGLASGVRHEEEGRRRAREDAVQQVVEYLGQTVESEYRLDRSFTQTGDAPAVSRTIVEDLHRALSRQTADRARQIDVHVEPAGRGGESRVWVLLEWDRSSEAEVVEAAAREAGVEPRRPRTPAEVAAGARSRLLGDAEP